MKTLIVFLLSISSMFAHAGKLTEITLNSNASNISFSGSAFAGIEYPAENLLCRRKQQRWDRVKFIQPEISQNQVSFRKNLGGFCQYHFGKGSFLLKRDGNSAVNLRIQSGRSAQEEV